MDSLSYKTISANASTVTKEWIVIDATNEVLGRLASQIAKILRGKNKPSYTPHVDCGDYVIVINAEKAVLTGKKLEQKYYRTHSGWIGGLKEVQYSTLMRERPELAMKLAVRGMMPRNVISKDSMSRLKIYRGGEHEHAAQKPELWAL